MKVEINRKMNTMTIDVKGLEDTTSDEINEIVILAKEMSFARSERASQIKDNMPKVMFNGELKSLVEKDIAQNIRFWFSGIEELLTFSDYETWAELNSGLTEYEVVHALSILHVLDDSSDIPKILDKTVEIIKNVRD